MSYNEHGTTIRVTIICIGVACYELNCRKSVNYFDISEGREANKLLQSLGSNDLPGNLSYWKVLWNITEGSPLYAWSLEVANPRITSVHNFLKSYWVGCWKFGIWPLRITFPLIIIIIRIRKREQGRLNTWKPLKIENLTYNLSSNDLWNATERIEYLVPKVLALNFSGKTFQFNWKLPTDHKWCKSFFCLY